MIFRLFPAEPPNSLATQVLKWLFPRIGLCDSFYYLTNNIGRCFNTSPDAFWTHEKNNEKFVDFVCTQTHSQTSQLHHCPLSYLLPISRANHHKTDNDCTYTHIHKVQFNVVDVEAPVVTTVLYNVSRAASLIPQSKKVANSSVCIQAMSQIESNASAQCQCVVDVLALT